MSLSAAIPLRILVVGPDAELAFALHQQAATSGWQLFTAPGPDDLEPIVRAVAPLLLVLALPAAPDASWGSALTVAQGAARAGVRVVMVAPAREVVEPLAAVAGAERAFSRSDLLGRPALLGELPPLPTRPAPARPPVRPAPANPAPASHVPPGPSPVRLADPPPPRAVPAAPAPPQPFAPRAPSIVPPTLADPDEVPARQAPRAAPDLMSLIDEELVQDTPRPPLNARVEVSVSLVSEHNFYVGPTRRIDSGGVFIATAMPPPVGTRLQVRLGLADGRKIDLEGEVAFLRAKSPTTGRQPAGCGVRLIGLPGWAIDAVERFFQARAPIIYAPSM